jgi:transcriptional regulator with XRE-family HTH domain
MYNIKNIPNNIRNARLMRNYSQDYLAMKLKMSQNGYSKIELGYTQLSLRKFLIIAEALEVDILDLLSDDDRFSSLQVVNS